MKKILAIIMSLILIMALTAGCSAKKDAETFTKDELIAVLDNCCSYEMDTAGGSLKSTIAAAGMVEFSAKNATEDQLNTISADMDEWYAALSDANKATLKANWNDIYTIAQSIISSPSDMAGEFEDAGVTTDFTNMDLSSGISVCNMLDSLMRG